MTQDEVVAWLRKDQRKRVVLVEQDYVYQVGVSAMAVPTIGTLYFSNFAYVDESSTPKTIYQGVLSSAASYERSIDRKTLRGKYNVTVGSTVINNADGEFDYLLDLALDGSEHRVYVGDETWARSDFVLLYAALAIKTSAPSKKQVVIDLRDPGLLLRKFIGGMVEVGGTEPSANKFRPINLGWVHQDEPIILDHTVGGGQYAHSDTGTNTAAVAVRNDGAPVAFADTADGNFTLSVPAAGNEKITCDVLATLSGGTTIGYRISDIIKEIVGTRGGLTAMGRYDGPRFDWIVGRTNDYPVGISIKEKRNLIDVLDDLMNTLNGFWAFDRTGMFYYYGMRPEALSAVIGESAGLIPVAAEIGKDDVRADSLVIDHAIPMYSSYQCLSNVNWSEQSTFGSSLTPDQRESFTRVGYLSTHFLGEDSGSSATQAYRGDLVSWLGGAPELYHLTLSDSQVVTTLISGATDDAVPDVATGENIDDYTSTFLSLRRSIYLPNMEFADFTAGLDLYFLELGDIVNFTFPRHGLKNGKLGQVCTVRIRPMQARVDLGLVRRRFADVNVSPHGCFFLLKEDGSYLLQEDGSRIEIGGGDLCDGDLTPPFVPPTTTAVTWSPTDKGAAATLSNGNLTTFMTSGGASGSGTNCTVGRSSGKHYCEVLIEDVDVGTFQPTVGLLKQGGMPGPAWPVPGGATGSGGGWGYSMGGTLLAHGVFAGSVGGYTVGDVVAWAVDFTAGKLWFAVNNVWLSGDPALGTSPTFTGVNDGITYCPSIGGPSSGGSQATAHFALADFTYTAPTGFSPW